jgi:hypothetical protein
VSTNVHERPSPQVDGRDVSIEVSPALWKSDLLVVNLAVSVTGVAPLGLEKRSVVRLNPRDMHARFS